MQRIVILGSDIELISGGHSYNDKFMTILSEMTGDEIVSFPSMSIKYSGWKKIFAPVCEIFSLRMFKKGDVVFFGDTLYKYHFLLLLFTRIFSKAKVAVIVHHFPYLDQKGMKRVTSFIIQRIYYGLFKFLIVPSPYTLSVAKDLYPHKDVIYVPIPFEIDYTPSEQYHSGSLLYVGTIERRKGLIYLLKAANELKLDAKSFHIDIVGKVSNQAYYQMLSEYVKANQLESYISFRGRVSDKELDQFYRNAEMFVLPSLLEGYGIVMVEAIKKGLPIIAFNNSAMPYSISNGENGYLASNENSVDLAKKIELILGDKEARKRMQENMKKIVTSLKTEKDFVSAIRIFAKKVELI